MPTLADDATMDIFVNAAIAMYNSWDTQAENQRRGAFERVIREICNEVDVPIPAFSWGDDGGAFYYDEWRLDCDQRAARIHPSRGAGALKNWLYYATSMYHEMRHGEQFFMIAKALLANKFPMPQPMSRAIAPGGDLPSRLTAVLGYPILISRRAFVVKATLPDSAIPLVRGWCESIWGRHARMRNQTYKHLDRRGQHINKYINLPEEADAWAVERQVSRKIRSRINSMGTEEALAGVAGLFD
jgi:hypothetical protein